MRGKMVQRNPGSWTMVIDMGKQIDPITGKLKRKQKKITLRCSEKEAIKKFTKIQYEIDNGVFVEPGKTTVKDYLESWLKDYCTPNLSPRSTETYNYMVHCHIIPSLGAVPITSLKPQHLQRLYSDKLSSGRADGKGGLSNRTVQYIHTTLNKSLSSAVKMGMLARNPCDAVDPPKVKRHEFNILNEDAINKLLEAARKTDYYALFFCALFTGMRRGELLALNWGNVDLLLMQLSVNRSLQHLENGENIFRQPKTTKSRRMISLSPLNCAVLRDHRAEQDKKRSAVGLPPTSDNDLVFCQLDGKPLLPDSVTHRWMTLTRETGLNGIRLHDARHTMASQLLKLGVHPKIVQERLGHSTISTTLDIYSSVAPGLQAAAANKLDDIISKHEDKLTKELNEIIR